MRSKRKRVTRKNSDSGVSVDSSIGHSIHTDTDACCYNIKESQLNWRLGPVVRLSNISFDKDVCQQYGLNFYGMDDEPMDLPETPKPVPFKFCKITIQASQTGRTVNGQRLLPQEEQDTRSRSDGDDETTGQPLVAQKEKETGVSSDGDGETAPRRFVVLEEEEMAAYSGGDEAWIGQPVHEEERSRASSGGDLETSEQHLVFQQEEEKGANSDVNHEMTEQPMVSKEQDKLRVIIYRDAVTMGQHLVAQEKEEMHALFDGGHETDTESSIGDDELMMQVLADKIGSDHEAKAWDRARISYGIPTVTSDNFIFKGAFLADLKNRLCPNMPDASQRTHNLSLRSSDISQQSSDVLQRTLVIPQGSPNLSRCTPDLARHTPDLARHTPDLAQHTPDLSRRTPELSQSTLNVSQQSPHVLRRTSFVTQCSPDVSWRTPDSSQSSFDVSVRSPDVSLRPPDVSPRPPVVSERSPDVFRTKLFVPQRSPDVSRCTADDSQCTSDVVTTATQPMPDVSPPRTSISTNRGFFNKQVVTSTPTVKCSLVISDILLRAPDPPKPTSSDGTSSSNEQLIPSVRCSVLLESQPSTSLLNGSDASSPQKVADKIDAPKIKTAAPEKKRITMAEFRSQKRSRAEAKPYKVVDSRGNLKSIIQGNNEVKVLPQSKKNKDPFKIPFLIEPKSASKCPQHRKDDDELSIFVSSDLVSDVESHYEPSNSVPGIDEAPSLPHQATSKCVPIPENGKRHTRDAKSNARIQRSGSWEDNSSEAIPTDDKLTSDVNSNAPIRRLDPWDNNSKGPPRRLGPWEGNSGVPDISRLTREVISKAPSRRLGPWEGKSVTNSTFNNRLFRDTNSKAPMQRLGFGEGNSCMPNSTDDNRIPRRANWSRNRGLSNNRPPWVAPLSAPIQTIWDANAGASIPMVNKTWEGGRILNNGLPLPSIESNANQIYDIRLPRSPSTRNQNIDCYRNNGTITHSPNVGLGTEIMNGLLPLPSTNSEVMQQDSGIFHLNTRDDLIMRLTHNLCRCMDTCRRTCRFAHEIPPTYKAVLFKSSPVWVIAIYKYILKFCSPFIIDEILPMVIDYLGSHKVMSEMLNLVSIVLNQPRLNRDRQRGTVHLILQKICSVELCTLENAIEEMIVFHGIQNTVLINMLLEILILQEDFLRKHWLIMWNLIKHRPICIDSSMVNDIIIECLRLGSCDKETKNSLYSNVCKQFMAKCTFNVHGVSAKLINEFLIKLNELQLNCCIQQIKAIYKKANCHLEEIDQSLSHDFSMNNNAQISSETISMFKQSMIDKDIPALATIIKDYHHLPSVLIDAIVSAIHNIESVTIEEFYIIFKELLVEMDFSRAEGPIKSVLETIGFNLCSIYDLKNSYDCACEILINFLPDIKSFLLAKNYVTIDPYKGNLKNDPEKLVLLIKILSRGGYVSEAYKLIKMEEFELFNENTVQNLFHYKTRVVHHFLKKTLSMDLPLTWEMLQYLLQNNANVANLCQVGVHYTSYLREVLKDALPEKVLEEFHKSIHQYYEYIKPNIVRPILATLYMLMPPQDLLPMYDYCCAKGIYSNHTGSEDIITLKSNITVDEIKMVFSMFFIKMLRLSRKPADLEIRIQVQERVDKIEVGPFKSPDKIDKQTMSVRLGCALYTFKPPITNMDDMNMVPASTVRLCLEMTRRSL